MPMAEGRREKEKGREERGRKELFSVSKCR